MQTDYHCYYNKGQQKHFQKKWNIIIKILSVARIPSSIEGRVKLSTMLLFTFISIDVDDSAVAATKFLISVGLT